MNSRNYYYLLCGCLLLAFISSFVGIKYIEKRKLKKDESEYTWLEKNSRFIFPMISLTSFFVGCYFVSLLIELGEHKGQDKYIGIAYISVIGIILLIINIMVLNTHTVNTFIAGKKFTISGMIMTIAISTLIFGFIDNFGMKLGTEALDDKFLQVFLSPFSVDKRFEKDQKNIKRNLETVNDWANNDWRKILNHTLRFKGEIAKNPRMKDLSNVLKEINIKPLDIPKDILKSRDLTSKYVKNIREKYDLIDGSKAMMGNTFSNFFGALLGGAIINLFRYMTVFEGFETGDENLDNSFWVRNVEYYGPLIEAVSVSIGCLIPVFLLIAMSRQEHNHNNSRSWIIVGIVALLAVIMIYISVYGIKDLTINEKVRGLSKNLDNIIERLGINENNGEFEKEIVTEINILKAKIQKK